MAVARFDMDDAWLLWAIPTNEHGTDLRGMISAADAINHAIPTREQIVRTVNRALRAGIIEEGGGLFRFASDIRDEIAAVNSMGTTWIKQWDAIHDFLSSREWPTVGKGTYRLTEARYRETVKEYVKEF